MALSNLTDHWPNVLLFLICMFWASLMFIAPLSQPPDTVDLGETGLVYPQLDNERKYEHIDNYLVRRVYESGDRNCHQHGSRSVFINGNQQPYCSRCVAIFVGMAIGAMISLLIFVRLDWKWVVAGLVPMGIDGSIQLVTAYESTNILRILTGFPAGLITTLALGGVLFEVGSMFSRLRAEKTATREAKGLDPPRIPFSVRPFIYSGGIILLLVGLVGADYVLHDGYNDEPREKIQLIADDAPFTAVNTSFFPGDDVFVLRHTRGENIDWAKIDIIMNWREDRYSCRVQSVNGQDYDHIINHITEAGEQVVVTLEYRDIPTGSSVSIEVLEDGGTLWASSSNIIIK